MQIASILKKCHTIALLAACKIRLVQSYTTNTCNLSTHAPLEYTTTHLLPLVALLGHVYIIQF